MGVGTRVVFQTGDAMTLSEMLLSRSAPERGEDLARYLPADLFEDAPTIEEAMGVPRPLTPISELNSRNAYASHLTVVKECASPSLQRFVPEMASPASPMLTPGNWRDVAATSPKSLNTVKDSPCYTLSPQSPLRLSGGGGSSGGSSGGESPTPPVAVYAYASSAGSSGGRNGSFAGRPPRGDKRSAFRPGSSLPHPRSGASFGHRNAPPAVKVNPAIGFTGAGFRAARDEYLDKILAFFHQRPSEDWVTIKGKQGVNGLCRKPVTMPETYLEFFSSHADKFQINDERTKVRIRPGASAGSSDSEGTNVDSLSGGFDEKCAL